MESFHYGLGLRRILKKLNYQFEQRIRKVTEDFTLPHIFHVDSIWTPGPTPGVHVEFRHFFFGGSPANFLSRINHPARLHMDQLHLTVLYHLLYRIKKVHDEELNRQAHGQG